MTQDYDPVAVEVHRKALENLTNEMALTLVRTSVSPIVTDAKDFSTCFLDVDAEQLGLSAYLLVHSASSWIGTRAVVDGLRASGEEPEPGDGWIVNDPYSGGAMHQGDVGVIMPMFVGGRLVGWGFANAHVLDVGGTGVSGIAPGAQSVYEEGLRFPPIKVISRGKLDRGWESYIASNVRAPVPVLSDIRGMIAVNNVARQRLETIVGRFGSERYHEYCELNKSLTEQLLRKRIADIPDGEYECVEFIEYDGHGEDRLVEIRCRLEVAGSDLRFGFTGAPQLNSFVNGTTGTVYGSVMTSILTVLAFGDLPFNAGMWRPISIDLGEPGTVVNAVEPAPVSMGHGQTGTRVTKAVRNVLSQALGLSDNPVLRRRVAGSASDGCAQSGLFGVSDSGNPTVLFHMDGTVGIGGGAQTTMDGQDAYGATMMAGCGLPDVEVHESTDPALFLWRGIPPNSAGPGQFRGGQGMDEAYLLRGAETMAGFLTTFCAELPPMGFGGGLPPSATTQYPVRTTDGLARMAGGAQPVTEDDFAGKREPVRNNEGKFTLHRGDVLRAIGGGGAGLGDPLLREPEAVATDLRCGFVTRTHAREAYGVVVTDGGAVDRPATARARDTMRRDRLGGEPSRELGIPEFTGVVVLRDTDGADWICGYCRAILCPLDEDWRLTGSVLREEPVVHRFERLEMRVRHREQSPAVLVREYYCRSCAGTLSVDVAPEGVHWHSPRLATTEGVRR